jgi:hypothetical protein
MLSLFLYLHIYIYNNTNNHVNWKVEMPILEILTSSTAASVAKFLIEKTVESYGKKS